MAANEITVLRQHINFYTELDRKQEPLLSARQIAFALLAFLVLMALPYASVYFSYTKIDRELAVLKQEHGQIKKQLDAANKTRDDLLKDTRYKVQIDKAQRELNFKQRVLSKVSRPENRSFNGFAQYLLGLARQHIQGMWLTVISLQESGRVVSMQGRALEPELIPQYIQGLRAEDVFAGKQFRDFSVEQVSGEEQVVAFSISGKGLDKGAEE